MIDQSDFEATVAAATNEAEIDVAVDQAIQAVRANSTARKLPSRFLPRR